MENMPNEHVRLRGSDTAGDWLRDQIDSILAPVIDNAVNPNDPTPESQE